MTKQKAVSVVDEHGDEWVVQRGDPGFKAVQILKDLGYRKLIIPFRILSGLKPFNDRTSWMALAAAQDEDYKLVELVGALEAHNLLGDEDGT